jgi:hypothetical protein
MIAGLPGVANDFISRILFRLTLISNWRFFLFYLYKCSGMRLNHSSSHQPINQT